MTSRGSRILHLDFSVNTIEFRSRGSKREEICVVLICRAFSVTIDERTLQADTFTGNSIARGCALQSPFCASSALSRVRFQAYSRHDVSRCAIKYQTMMPAYNPVMVRPRAYIYVAVFNTPPRGPSPSARRKPVFCPCAGTLFASSSRHLASFFFRVAVVIFFLFLSR